ncbi:hypothetical protein BB560_005808 [Smittium megazygosporum]|uniref:Autophagy-related protein 101 n=1 Tax=Smittium megazygosporum TaxID=133381 RepID=A0A2T9YVQ9_9FUNG|nr:hypothetical protein BB560_005808 [Smittium megazygosporum]
MDTLPGNRHKTTSGICAISNEPNRLAIKASYSNRIVTGRRNFQKEQLSTEELLFMVQKKFGNSNRSFNSRMEYLDKPILLSSMKFNTKIIIKGKARDIEFNVNNVFMDVGNLLSKYTEFSSQSTFKNFSTSSDSLRKKRRYVNEEEKELKSMGMAHQWRAFINKAISTSMATSFVGPSFSIDPVIKCIRNWNPSNSLDIKKLTRPKQKRKGQPKIKPCEICGHADPLLCPFTAYKYYREKVEDIPCRQGHEYLEGMKVVEFSIDINVEFNYLQSTLNAILNSIVFYRYFSPLKPKTEVAIGTIAYPIVDDQSTIETINKEVSRFVDSIKNPCPSKSIIIEFMTKVTKKSWFTVNEEFVCWERWVLNICIRDSDQIDLNSSYETLKKDLRNTLFKIINFIDSNKNHIPLISNSQTNPFPFKIYMHNDETKKASKSKRS